MAASLVTLVSCRSGAPGAGAPPAPPATPLVPAASAAASLAAAAVELTVPAHPDSLDFAAVGRLVGDARVVMLGEPSHGDGGAIALKTQVIRYLHEQKGFDVLVLEADFYALHEAWRFHAREVILGAVLLWVIAYVIHRRRSRRVEPADA